MTRFRASLLILSGCAFAGLLIHLTAVHAQGNKPKLLRIGSTDALGVAGDPQRQKAAEDTLKSFIKDETGFDNELVHEKNWQQVAADLAQGKIQVGAFDGQEYAWAQEKQPGLKPLALAINVYTYPVAYVITRKDNGAKDFAGLQGKSLSIPGTGRGFRQYFVEHECQARGKTVAEFFSGITTPEFVEDAIDDVVDGKVGATVVDRVGLEAFKSRKPARFNQLKPVDKSQSVPPPVLAYEEGKLDKATVQRFRTGLLGASQKERGQTLLTLFHLSGFVLAPEDFDKVVTETRKAYPPLKNTAK